MVVQRYRWLDRYPGVGALSCLTAGIVAARYLGPFQPAVSAGVLAAALLGGIFVLRKGSGHSVGVAVGLVFCALGGHLGSADLQWGDEFHGTSGPAIVNAAIADTLGSGTDFRHFLLDSGVIIPDGRVLPGFGRLLLRANSVHLGAGDRIAFKSRIRKPTNRGNPGEYDWEIHCKSEGIGWQVSVHGEDSVLVVRRAARWSWRAPIVRVRQAMNGFLDTHCGRGFGEDTRRQVRAILKGIVLGDRAEIDPPLNRAFTNSGLAHLLAASGMNVGMVALTVLMFVRVGCRTFPGVLLSVPLPKIVAAAAIPAMIAYCLLVGSKVPVVRATIMGLVFCGAVLLERRWHSFHTLALAGLMILLVYPLSLFTPSLQLSFAAVAGIFLVVSHLIRRLSLRAERPPGEEKSHRHGGRAVLRGILGSVGSWGAALLITSIAATVAVTPLLVQHFHAFPVYTLFANIAADLLMTGALSIGLVASTVGAVWPELGAVLLIPADWLTWMIIRIAFFFSGLPWSTIRIGHPGTLEIVLVGGLCGGALWSMRTRSRVSLLVVAGTAALLTLVSLGNRLGPGGREELKAVFLNVGHGDAAFVQPPGSKGLLVDAGARSRTFDAGLSVILPFFMWNGTRGLDACALSHPEMDHMGGLLSVIQDLPPRRIWWNPVEVCSPHLAELLMNAQQAGISFEAGDRTQSQIALGAATISFLNRTGLDPRQRLPRPDLNNASMVFRLDFGNVSMLFPGDLEREGEAELIKSGLPLRATILKVGHHGGKSSITQAFLDSVNPCIAIISADYPITRGGSRDDLIERLSTRGCRVFWTGRDGAITVTTDGARRVTVTTGRTGERWTCPRPP